MWVWGSDQVLCHLISNFVLLTNDLCHNTFDLCFTINIIAW